VRRLVHDLADLPVRQRTALLDAHERGVRPSEHALRHLKGCDACRAYQRDIRRLSKQLQALNPALGLPIVAGLAKVLGGGGGKAVAAAGAAAVVIAATGGVVVLSSDTANTGDPAPFRIKGFVPLSGKPITTADPIPSNTAVVTARVRLPAGAPKPGERRSVTLSCPPGMKVAGFQNPEQRFPLSYGLTTDTIFGYSTRGRISFGRAILPRAYEATVGLLCRRPDAHGSIVDNPRLPQPGEQPGRLCATREHLYHAPGKVFVGTVDRGQPLSIQRRSASGKWVRVVTDARNAGWLRASGLCR
jgi:hypothetical protein